MEYNIDMKKELLATTSTSFRKLLELGSDAMALYMFYLYTSNYQDNQQVFASVRFIAKGMGWTKDRVVKNNKLLKESGWIEEIIKKNLEGKIEGWYTKVNYRVTSGTIPEKNHIPDFQNLVLPESGFSGQNAPLRNKIQHKEENTPVVEEVIDFKKFWDIYPSRRKSDKEKCKIKWGRLDLATQKIIIDDVPRRVLGRDWTKSNGDYIPAPLSYINGEKWLADIVPVPGKTLPTKLITGNAELDSY